jgi:hypothetical protein
MMIRHCINADCRETLNLRDVACALRDRSSVACDTCGHMVLADDLEGQDTLTVWEHLVNAADARHATVQPRDSRGRFTRRVA